MKTECPHCKKQYDVENELCNQIVECANCKNEFVVEPFKEPFINKIPYDIAQMLLPGERVRKITAPPGRAFYLAFIIGAITAPILIGIIVILKAIIQIKCTRYIITSQRIIAQTGFFNKQQTEINLNDIRAVSVSVPLEYRIVNVGTICIGTAATAGVELSLVAVQEPQEIMVLINNLRKKSSKATC